MAKQVINDRGAMEAVLKASEVGTLGLVGTDGSPYLVPVNYVYLANDELPDGPNTDGAQTDSAGMQSLGRIIFHCALTGHKLDCIAKEPRVCFNVWSGLRMVYSSDKACDCSARYQSVTCFGVARVVEDHAHKVSLLTALTEQYMEHSVEPPGDARTRKTCVVEIVVAEMTGKRNVDAAE